MTVVNDTSEIHCCYICCEYVAVHYTQGWFQDKTPCNGSQINTGKQYRSRITIYDVESPEILPWRITLTEGGWLYNYIYCVARLGQS